MTTPATATGLVTKARLLEAEAAKRAGYLVKGFYQDDGPYRRELYEKFLEFFAAGKTHRERVLLAANRVGKTRGVGAFETTLHLTGAYDEFAPWWNGRTFDGPIEAWAAGDTAKTCRDIVQDALYGPPARPRTGMLPAHLIEHVSPKAGVPDALETIWVRHVERHHGAPCVSVLQLKSYDQKRESFQGTSKRLVWLDEEPPLDVYTECLLRTMDTPELPGGGMVLATFTPLQGLTELIKSFYPDEVVQKLEDAVDDQETN